MKIKIAALFIAALALSSCAAETVEELPEETSVTTVYTEPEADHTLLRGWTMNELFGSIQANGKSFPFPIKISDFDEGGSLSDCTFSDNKIQFPDGSFISANLSSENKEQINYLCAEDGSAPKDLSVYGIQLGISAITVRDDFGIPDEVIDKPDKEKGIMIYYGAKGQQFAIEFEDCKAVRFIFTQY